MNNSTASRSQKPFSPGPGGRALDAEASAFSWRMELEELVLEEVCTLWSERPLGREAKMGGRSSWGEMWAVWEQTGWWGVQHQVKGGDKVPPQKQGAGRPVPDSLRKCSVCGVCSRYKQCWDRPRGVPGHVIEAPLNLLTTQGLA